MSKRLKSPDYQRTLTSGHEKDIASDLTTITVIIFQPGCFCSSPYVE